MWIKFFLFRWQKSRAQFELDGPYGAAEIDVVLGWGWRQDVPGKGKGWGDLSKLRESFG